MVAEKSCSSIWYNLVQKLGFCWNIQEDKFPPPISDIKSATGNIVQEDILTDNGFNLCEIVIPETILEFILCEVAEEDILNCRLVCRTWKNLIARKYLWKRRFERRRVDICSIPASILDKPDAWLVFYAHLRYLILSKNYIGNSSGERGLEGWTMWDNVGRGHRWRVKESLVSLAATSLFNGTVPFYFDNLNDLCSKYYIVDLWREGLTPKLMKLLLPFRIKCSQLYASKCDDFDGIGLFNWEIRLLNSQEKTIAKHKTGMELPRKVEWRMVEHSFNFSENSFELLDDLRYVVFIHGGDQLYYGIKLAKSCLTIECLENNPVPDIERNYVQLPIEMEDGGANAIAKSWPTTSVHGWTELGRLALK
ncbi:unnamed protein product [Orchesella dallaii]|uniref:F-box domain-containing protein n=1 Tax=Orchesella dallaii TaxID=48710 RepID=A0ABP1PLV3_9HEXA